MPWSLGNIESDGVLSRWRLCYALLAGYTYIHALFCLLQTFTCGQYDVYPCSKLTEGHLEVVELLLNHGADIKATDKVQYIFPLVVFIIAYSDT